MCIKSEKTVKNNQDFPEPKFIKIQNHYQNSCQLFSADWLSLNPRWIYYRLTLTWTGIKHHSESNQNWLAHTTTTKHRYVSFKHRLLGVTGSLCAPQACSRGKVQEKRRLGVPSVSRGERRRTTVNGFAEGWHVYTDLLRIVVKGSYCKRIVAKLDLPHYSSVDELQNIYVLCLYENTLIHPVVFEQNDILKVLSVGTVWACTDCDWLASHSRSYY